MSLCVLKTLAKVLYLLYFLPFTSKLLNFQHIMNECLIGVAFSIAFVFTKGLNPIERNNHGYLIIGIVGIILTFNIIVVLVDIVKMLGILAA